MARRRFAWWKLVSIVVLGFVVVRGGACATCTNRPVRAQPDERLAGHFTRLCEVAADGVAHPQRGVRKLMRYHGDHGPDMLEAFGATLVLIERIEDDTLHDARARLARARIQAPLIACEETWIDFGEAVEADPEASRILEEGLVRLGRTLEIIVGESRARELIERFSPAVPAASR
jgi:hypothetical protein